MHCPPPQAWVVVLMQGLAILAILTWTGYRAVQQVLSNQVSLLGEGWGSTGMGRVRLVATPP